MKKNQSIVIGNWKMNPQTLVEAKRIVTKTKAVARTLEHTLVVACPPFPFVSLVASKRNSGASGNRVHAGVQNAFFEEQGAYTGEVSTHMLADIGVEYVIVGHSERRARGETDVDVSKKVVAVTQSGMTAVLCVGETVRDAQGAYLNTLREQIKASLQAFPKRQLSQLIIAYEPVWAIGAKEAMTPVLVREMVIFVKKVISDTYGQEEALAVPVLYGGSVNFRNAADIMIEGHVDGFLVGRESVNVPGFIELIKVVDGVSAKK